MHPWSHLPNSQHINLVIASFEKHPAIWNRCWNQPRAIAFAEALNRVWKQDRTDAWEAAKKQAQSVSHGMNLGLMVSWYAIIALIAYDDCAKYLQLDSPHLNTYYSLTEYSECALLLPSIRVFELENELGGFWTRVDNKWVWAYNIFIH